MADIQTVITGNVQQAQNILNSLLGQTGQYASSLQSDNQPFFNQAQNVLNNFPSIISGLYNNTSNSISNLFNNLYSNINQQMQNQWAQSSDVLSALGMYNSPATQQTQANITTNLYGKIAQEETNMLAGLDTSQLGTLVNYYQNLPKQEQMLAGWNVQMDPTLTNFGLQMQIAQALNGLNVGVLPQQSELSQFAQEAPGIIGALGGALQLGEGLLGLATGNPLPMFMGFTGGISPWLSMAGNALGSLWSGVENIGSDLLSDAGNVISDIGSGIGDVVSDIGNAIGSLF
jgi:hypothetical protein